MTKIEIFLFLRSLRFMRGKLILSGSKLIGRGVVVKGIESGDGIGVEFGV